MTAVETPVGRADRPGRFDVAALLGLVAVLALLWGQARNAWYWTDEGLSLGISSHSLGQMRELLARDTSPPLYHVFLHGWMRLFGSSEAATHSLSLLFALAAVPAGLWAGWSLFGRRAGWMCALLAGVSPFLADAGNETRMYSLVALLSVLVTATFVHAFVFRRRRYLPAFAIFLALTLYTHYWGFLLAFGASVAWLVCWFHGNDRRGLVIDATLGFGAAALLFVPWLPTFLHQRAHSAVGWALPPSLEQVRIELIGLVGGTAPAVALAVGAGAAIVAMLRRPWSNASVVVVVALTIVVVALGAGWVVSRSTSQWHARYLGVVLGPLLIVLGAALARGGDLAVAMVGIVALLSGALTVDVALDAKSDAGRSAAEASPLLSDGAVVFAPIGTVPLLAHYLPDGLRYATTTGPVADPLAADWTDAMERVGRTDPVATLSPLIDHLPGGGRVLVSCPATEGVDLDGLPPYVELEIRRCLAGRDHLLSRPDLQIERRLPGSARSGGPGEMQILTKRAG